MADSLNRRDFVKTSIAGLAGAISAEGGAASADQRGRETLVLENEHLAWEFSRSKQGIVSTGLRNKLTGRHFEFKQATELLLRFSAAKKRIEIPWWRCTFGPDGDTALPEKEQGYTQGYQRPGFDDSKWPTCLNLGLRGLPAGNYLAFNQGRPPATYQGYGWFRALFTLPAEPKGEEVVLNVGGYDYIDWKEYWVYVNGIEVGHRSISTPWRTAGQYRISLNSPAYAALRFGDSEKNLFAVRTHSYDRHYSNLNDDLLDRHIFDPVLFDQFITVGEPFQEISAFEVGQIRQGQDGDRPVLEVELVNRGAQLRANLHYELEGPIRRKWVEVHNESSERKLLLDVDLDTLNIDEAIADGGYGYPLTIVDQIFGAVEHPSGFNRWDGHRVRLTHFPGKWLEPGKAWKSYGSIFGVAGKSGANRQFLEYIESHTFRKKKILAIYDPFGITAFTEGRSWGLNDDQNLGTLDLLAEWQKKGIRFDYYILEMSLDTTSDSDLKRFCLFSFPDGPAKVIERIHELGMKTSQYFSVTYGGWSNSRNPKTAPSRVPTPGGDGKVVMRHGYLAGGAGSLCVASEPYFSMLKDAAIHHVKNNGADLIKLDDGDYYCNATDHEHLPGKYSTEESFSRLIQIAQAAREANRDLFLVWYWGVYSPFFALHGDVVFDVRISLEAASTGDYPALFFRDAVTQALDQGCHFAKWLPPLNHDSLGIWLANNWWGNQMETVRWQEATLMDLARGNMLFPQIWSDINNFEEQDVEFLARIQGLVKQNERVFLTRCYTIGDPWQDEIYGYSYFDGDHGFVFLNNMSFAAREVKLELGEAIGLAGRGGGTVRLQVHHPGQAVLTHGGNPEFAIGEAAVIQLRPFEVIMIEALPAASGNPGLPARETIETSPVYSYHVASHQSPNTQTLEMHFADAAKLESQGFRKRVNAHEATLPAYAGGRYHVALVDIFRKKGRYWRQSQMSSCVQAIAEVDGTVIEFTATPDFRQVGNNQWNPWIVFSAPLPASFAGRQIQFGISSYLPEDVEMTTDLWVVKEWWRPRMKSLPNYWV